jgi:hypothetical protein
MNIYFERVETSTLEIAPRDLYRVFSFNTESGNWIERISTSNEKDAIEFARQLRRSNLIDIIVLHNETVVVNWGNWKVTEITKPCPDCNGEGEIDDDCEDCEGTGYELDENGNERDEVCDECRGGGHIMNTCENCNGEGEVPV